LNENTQGYFITEDELIMMEAKGEVMRNLLQDDGEATKDIITQQDEVVSQILDFLSNK
jgi:hypothetical protein